LKSGSFATSSSQRYGRWLWALLTLFVVRVVAQPLALLISAPFLPPFESWHSGVLPYPWLVVAQLLIIAWFGRTAWHFSRGDVVPNHRLGIWMLILGGIYFAVMLARLALGLTVLSNNRWFSSILPTLFHLVIASYLIVYGHFHFSYGRGAHAHPMVPRQS
jgi:hypothetical protein